MFHQKVQLQLFCSETSSDWAHFPAAAVFWFAVMSGDKVAIIPDIPPVASQPPRLSPVEKGNERVKR